ncbi:MAG TPA: amino acid adenylation domain-containing protein [Thermoanaerobaculia bacterium]|nr:amino acid adenylation domain-containing protein [Thermoanaerobaculia bacterium]
MSSLPVGSQVESIYPLSPMQHGMLFHSLSAPDLGVYFEQLSCELREEVDLEAFRGAWQRVMDRHPILRTAFDWESLDEPVQVVLRRLPLPLGIEDWRHLTSEEQGEKLQELLRTAPERGFDFRSAPLFRLSLIRLASDLYQFVWSHHHLLLDGWSMPLLFGEFFSSYRALREGREPLLPRLRPFSDYIAWLQRQDLVRAESFWRRELSEFAAPTPLPLGRPLPGSVPVAPYADRELCLGPGATAALQELGKRSKLTLNTLVQGAWALLLSRRSGEEDVVFGSVVSGRPADLPGVETMTGLFLNTLPIRVRVPPDEPFLPWAAALQARAADLRQFEHTPLVQVQGWSAVPRGTPLFESIVVFENYPLGAVADPRDGEPRITGVRVQSRTSFPLTLVVNPAPDLGLKLRHDCRRFDAGAVDELLRQLRAVLEEVAAGPEAALGSFSLLTPEARRLLPDPSAPLPEREVPSWLSRFRDVCERWPDRPAVERGEHCWSYRDLDGRSAALARLLRGRGATAGEVVAVLGERSFGLIVAALGVLRSGGVLLLLDPALPAERRRVMASQAGVAHRIAAGAAPAAEEEWLGVDPQTGSTAEPPGGSTPVAAGEPRPEDPAYVFFTSGTTGLPKGVLGRHKGLSHFLAWQQSTFAVGPGDRSAQLTGISFDVVLRDLFLPLTSGATVCLPAAGLEVVSPGILEWLQRSRPTLLHAVPSLAQAWLAAAPATISLASLRCTFFAGEPLTADLVDRWRRTFGVTGEVVNLYGPTETTLAKCVYRVPPDPEPGIQTVGLPLPDTQALVLAGSGRLCGVGEPGEIVIRTPFRTLGYLDASAEETGRFVPNPARHDPDDLVYRTGDRGCYREDGRLAILGRLDEQVKIGGIRIEPAGIAAVLRGHPDLKAAALVLREDAPGEKRLVAYVVPAAGREPAQEDLVAFARARLPDALVPAAFVTLDAIPLTANGKLDRGALPVPRATRPALRASYVLARDAVELALVQIWEEVLGVRPVGVKDGFFDLGGHSLRVVSLLSRIEKRFGRPLSVAVLLEAQTVERLAAVLRRGGPVARSPLLPLQVGVSGPALFCVHPLGGSALCYQSLARQLGPQQPVYGLDALHLLGAEQLYRSLEEMASAYVEAVRRQQPRGPYLLTGWSFGGLVAFEMARQLAGSGEEVPLLALFDTQAPEPPRAEHSLDDFLIITELLGSDLGRSAEELAAMGLDAALSHVVELGKKLQRVPADYDVPMARQLLEIIRMNGRTLKTYTPVPFPGRLTFFQAAEEERPGAAPRSEAWRPLAGELDVSVVPGSHRRLLDEPYVEGLAQHLRRVIAEMNEKH